MVFGRRPAALGRGLLVLGGGLRVLGQVRLAHGGGCFVLGGGLSALGCRHLPSGKYTLPLAGWHGVLGGWNALREDRAFGSRAVAREMKRECDSRSAGALWCCEGEMASAAGCTPCPFARNPPCGRGMRRGAASNRPREEEHDACLRLYLRRRRVEAVEAHVPRQAVPGPTGS